MWSGFRFYGWSSRSAILAFLWLALGACGSSSRDASENESDTAQGALQKACEYLWSRQGEDGGWRSDTYALFGTGQALTPFVLYALLEAPKDRCPAPAGGVDKALEFIRRLTNDEGVLGAADPDVLEYPNYATAYALRCLIRAGHASDHVLIAKMRERLIAQQYAPESGFPESSLAYGGWGFGGARRPDAPGHMDLAHTRQVLQALSEAGVDDPTLSARAEAFLRLLQKHPDEKRDQPVPSREPSARGGKVPYDGGFYFSPVVFAANKGGFHSDLEGGNFRSYATATCEGALALLSVGLSAADERVAAARRWLERHPRWDYPEGIPPDQAEDWGRALHFYHLAVRSEIYDRLDWPGAWRAELKAVLVPLQGQEGSFRNRDNHLMKEDDPLLATSLAVLALARASR